MSPTETEYVSETLLAPQLGLLERRQDKFLMKCSQHSGRNSSPWPAKRKRKKESRSPADGRGSLNCIVNL